ncbi:MAG: type II toxin-antitoxin system HicA family toxin [Candidatus Acidiferrales bacterium]
MMRAALHVHHQSGSHAQLRRPSRPRLHVTVPRHDRFDLPRSVLRSRRALRMLPAALGFITIRTPNSRSRGGPYLIRSGAVILQAAERNPSCRYMNMFATIAANGTSAS